MKFYFLLTWPLLPELLRFLDLWSLKEEDFELDEEEELEEELDDELLLLDDGVNDGVFAYQC